MSKLQQNFIVYESSIKKKIECKQNIAKKNEGFWLLLEMRNK